MQNQNLLYQFLTMTCGSWRNAFFVGCIDCPYGNEYCSGHLLTTDAECAPFILPVPFFEKITGDKIDKSECAAIITKEAFESLFHRWLDWNVTKPQECSILQILPTTNKPFNAY